MTDANTTAMTFDTLADFAPDWVARPGDTIADLLEVDVDTPTFARFP